MPINYKNYHPDWKRISQDIRLIRAGNKCEKCGIKNYTVRLYEDSLEVEKVIDLPDYKTARERANQLLCDADGNAHGKEVYRTTVVVLTVAHLDHDVTNNDPQNLKALCQSCHLGHDRQDNSARRKYGKTGRYYGQVKLDF